MCTKGQQLLRCLCQSANGEHRRKDIPPFCCKSLNFMSKGVRCSGWLAWNGKIVEQATLQQKRLIQELLVCLHAVKNESIARNNWVACTFPPLGHVLLAEQSAICVSVWVSTFTSIPQCSPKQGWRELNEISQVAHSCEGPGQNLQNHLPGRCLAVGRRKAAQPKGKSSMQKSRSSYQLGAVKDQESGVQR